MPNKNTSTVTVTSGHTRARTPKAIAAAPRRTKSHQLRASPSIKPSVNIAARSLPADAASDLAAEILERGAQRVPERANGLVHALLRLGIAEGVPDRSERLVQMIDGLPERLVHHLALLLGGRACVPLLLPVMLAESPTQIEEMPPDVVPRLARFVLAAPGLLGHVRCLPLLFPYRATARSRAARLPLRSLDGGVAQHEI